MNSARTSKYFKPAVRRRSRWLQVMACVLGVGCADVAPETPRWRLTETMRLGGAESGPMSLDAVKGIDEGADGRVYVYDQSTQDVRVFATDGTLIRVIGRVGAGPGELRNAEGIVVASDGRLWVRDAANARFTIFGPDGVFERSWSMRFCTSQGRWDARVDPTGRLVDEDCIVEGDRAVRVAVLAYHIDLSRVDTLRVKPECGTAALAESGTWITRSPTRTSYRAIPFRAIYHSAVGPDGEVWCVPNSARYELWRVGLATTDSVYVERRLSPLLVSSSERDSIIEEFEASGPTGLDFSRLPTVKPAIDRLEVDDRGRLWVRRSNADGSIAFDVFDRAGMLVGTATLSGYRISLWRPFVVRGNNVYAVVLGEDDLQFVVRFRIEDA